MIVHIARAGTISAFLLATISVAGHSQIGGLLKKGKNTAEGKATDAAAAQVPPTTVDVLPCAVTYDELAALEKGLKAELDAAPAAKKEAEDRQKASEADRKAYEQATADYTKKDQAYEACRDKVMNDPAAKKKSDEMAAKMDASNQKAGDIDQAALEAQAAKAQAAAQKVANGTATAADRQVLADFQAMMAGISKNSNAAVAVSAEATALNKEQEEKMKKCGEAPQAPKAPSSLDWSPERVLLEKGAGAAGMNPEKYKVVRDCAIKSANLRLSSKNTPEGEAKRINDKLAEIQQTMNSMRAAKVPV